MLSLATLLRLKCHCLSVSPACNLRRPIRLKSGCDAWVLSPEFLKLILCLGSARHESCGCACLRHKSGTANCSGRPIKEHVAFHKWGMQGIPSECAMHISFLHSLHALRLSVSHVIRCAELQRPKELLDFSFCRTCVLSSM